MAVLSLRPFFESTLKENNPMKRIESWAWVIALLSCTGCQSGGESGARQILQSGLTTKGRAGLVPRNASLSTEKLTPVARLTIDQVELRATSVPVYFDPEIYKTLFKSEEDKKAEEEKSWWGRTWDSMRAPFTSDAREKLLGQADSAVHMEFTESGTLQSLFGSGTIQKLWSNGIRKAVEQSGVDYGARIIVAVGVRSLSGAGATPVSDPVVLFDARNILLLPESEVRTNPWPTTPAVFQWSADQPKSSGLAAEREIEIEQGEIVLLAASDGGTYELEFTITERSNIADALDKIATKLQEATEDGDLQLGWGSFFDGSSWGALAEVGLKLLADTLQDWLRDMLKQHQAIHQGQIFVSKALVRGTVEVVLQLEVGKSAEDLSLLEVRQPLRRLLPADKELTDRNETFFPQLVARMAVQDDCPSCWKSRVLRALVVRLSFSKHDGVVDR
jgi:hypothetical protein